MLRRVESDSFLTTMLEAITDYDKDDYAVEIVDKHAITPKGG